MADQTLYQIFWNKLFECYPSTQELENQLDLEHFVFPHVVELDKRILHSAKQFVQALFQLSRSKIYQQAINTIHQDILSHPPLQQSVLMAYDFHTPPHRMALIEINTNAAMYLVTDLLNQCQQIPPLLESPPLEFLKQSFIEEYRQFRKDPQAIPEKVVITDEKPPTQKRYIEFLMFKDLFSAWGWNPEIIDVKDLRIENSTSLVTPAGEKIDLLYNRYCDFYLNQPESNHLRQAYLQKLCCVTPNPFEYLLLADKGRMSELSSPEFVRKILPAATSARWGHIRPLLIPTTETSHFENSQDIWDHRNKYFFKPQNEYGGNSVYFGEDLSPAIFQRILKENFLIQEYVPAPEPKFLNSSFSSEGWKYDLRFYAYRDQIQNVVARVYRGQVTNFTQSQSGFAAVMFS